MPTSRASAAASETEELFAPETLETRQDLRSPSTEDINVRMAREHFAAESAHDTPRTLATLHDDIMYHVVASGQIVLRQGSGVQVLRRVVDRLPRRRASRSSAWSPPANASSARTSPPPRTSGPGSACRPPGSKTVQHLCAVLRFRDGLMTEETVYYDQLERIMQLGSDALPRRPQPERPQETEVASSASDSCCAHQRGVGGGFSFCR